MRNLVVCGVAILVIAARPCPAQIRNAGTGSTVEGDVRRGEGVFLQGLGWYELSEAKAFDQYAKTVRENDAYFQQQNAAVRRAYNAQLDEEARKRKLTEAAKKQDLEQREYRLRTAPTQEDIEQGDALNALLVDLADPTIQSSSWRGSRVDLPGDISIKALAFQFTPRPGARASAALSQVLIASGRLDTAGRWPDVFPLDKLKPEIAAYETAYLAICEQSKAKRLELTAVLAMDRSLETLKNRVKVVVPPERGFRNEAVKYVDNLKFATKMFDASTLGYAREMIADTSQHEAHTVSELLAFMRKYRLVFAKADAAPGGVEMYSRLYGLLRSQSEALGLRAKRPVTEQARSGGLPPGFPAVIEAGSWKLEDGELIQTSDRNDSRIIFGQDFWSHYDMRYEVRFDSGRMGSYTYVGYADSRNHKCLYSGGYNNTMAGIDIIIVGVRKEIKRRDSIQYGRWYSVLIEVRGTTVRWYMDDKHIFGKKGRTFPTRQSWAGRHGQRA